MRQIDVPTDSTPELELGGHSSRYIVEEGGEGGNRKGESGTETEGGSQEGGTYTLSRGRSFRKGQMKGQTKVTQKWIWAHLSRGGHISVALKTQEGAHDQHIPDRLR